MFLFLFFQGNFFSGPGDLTTLYQNLVPRWVSTVQPYALDLFGALAGLDLAFFGWSLWRTAMSRLPL